MLILSGRYGFVLPHEPIQNYSCHFADRLDEDEIGLGRSYSKEVLPGKESVRSVPYFTAR